MRCLWSMCWAPPPSEAGYWIGMRIAEAYVDRAPDKRAAMNELIELRDPVGILKASGYGSELKPASNKGAIAAP